MVYPYSFPATYIFKQYALYQKQWTEMSAYLAIIAWKKKNNFTVLDDPWASWIIVDRAEIYLSTTRPSLKYIVIFQPKLVEPNSHLPLAN